MIRFDRTRLRNAAAREEALSVLEETLEAISPYRLIRGHVSLSGTELRVGEESYPIANRRVFLLGAGKAAAVMAQALEAILGDALTAGAVVTRYGYSTPTKRVQVHEGGHPLPDSNGAAGALALQTLAKGVRREDLVLCVFSGGGSALLSLESVGIDLADLRALNDALLRSGAAIDEVNAVRRHVVPLLGGGLARLLAPAETITLLLSDVVGDRLEAIASGPTVPDPTTFADAQGVLLRANLWDVVPCGVRDRIEQGLHGEVPETPKPGDTVFARTTTLVVGNNQTAVLAAVCAGERRGRLTQELAQPIVGEARGVGKYLAQLARDLAVAGSERALCVGGGETTVVVAGPGRGGRNQEVALAAAMALEGKTDATVIALATDGTDGPTDAAGAIVDGETVRRARAAGFDPTQALERNDAYPLLLATGDLLFSGPTCTNVADLFLVLAGAGRKSAWVPHRTSSNAVRAVSTDFLACLP